MRSSRQEARRARAFRAIGQTSIALPIGSDLGSQSDFLSGERGNGTFLGGAAHLFMRNPALGSVGVYGSLAHFDGQLSSYSNQTEFLFGKAGVTAEAYSGRFSLEALAGIDTGGIPK